MPPKKPNKAAAIEELCDMIEKRKLKAQTALTKAIDARSIDLMSDADSELDKAMDALAAHGKIPAAIKKKRITPVTDGITTLREAIRDARNTEQALRQRELYDEWLMQEGLKREDEHRAMRPKTAMRIRTRDSEQQRWGQEEEWAAFLHCSHLPDPRSESDLNDFLTDWENDTSQLTLTKAVQESGAGVHVISSLRKRMKALELQRDRVLRTEEEAGLDNALLALTAKVDASNHDAPLAVADDAVAVGADSKANEEMSELREGEEPDQEQDFFSVPESHSEIILRLQHLREFVDRLRAIIMHTIDEASAGMLQRSHQLAKEEACDFAQFAPGDEGLFGDLPVATRPGLHGVGSDAMGQIQVGEQDSVPELAVCWWVNTDVAHNVRYKEPLQYPLRGQTDGLVLNVPLSILKRPVALRLVFVRDQEALALPLSLAAGEKRDESLAAHALADKDSAGVSGSASPRGSCMGRDKEILKDFVTLGGVMVVEMFAIPEAPKTLRSMYDVKHKHDASSSGKREEANVWKVRQEKSEDHRLKRISYPETTPAGAAKQEPPMIVDMALPHEVIVVPGAGLTVGRWDPDLAAWIQDGVEGVELVDALQAPATDSAGTAQGEEVVGTASSLLHRIKFQTFFLTHLAVLQSSIACFPYESWRLSPCDNGTGAVLSLALRCGWQVHVEVTPRGSRIREPAPKAMQHLCAADLVPPEELLRRLRLQGLNLTPEDSCVLPLLHRRDEQVGEENAPWYPEDWHPPFLCPIGTPKHKVLETRLSKDLALMAPAFVVESSPYNHWVSPSEAVAAVRAANSLPPHETHDAPPPPPPAPPADAEPVIERPQTGASSKKGNSSKARGADKNSSQKAKGKAKAAAVADDAAERQLRYGHVWRPPPSQFMSSRHVCLTLLQEKFGDEACATCLATSPSLSDNVYKLLLLVRPFSFDAPRWQERAPLPPLVPQPDPAWQTHEDETGRTYYTKTPESGEQAVSWTQPMLPLLPPGWLTMTDESSNRNYFVHPPSGTSQWERPPLPSLSTTVPAILSAAESAAAEDRHRQGFHEEGSDVGGGECERGERPKTADRPPSPSDALLAARPKTVAVS